jgi:hypothetical protein
MAEQRPEDEYQEIEYVVTEGPPRRRSAVQRLGCAAVVLLWMIVLLIPFFLFILAVDGEITLGHGGDIPEPEGHPLLQVRLVSEIDFRGLHITTSSQDRLNENNTCVQTNVRYLLWQGDGDPAVFCECFEREQPDAPWRQISTVTEPCGAGDTE